MKLHLKFIALILTLFSGTTLATLAQEAEALPAATLPATEETNSSKLYVVVVDNVSIRRSNQETFTRIKIEFTKAFEKEAWGEDVQFERFGYDTPEGAQELRIFVQSLKTELVDDLTFRAWITFHEGGEKIDLGVIKAKTNPRAGQNADTSLNQVFKEAARLTKNKLNKEVFK